MDQQFLTIILRKISIHSTPLHIEWENKKFNIIDTPGYSDFIGEALGSLSVVDSAVLQFMPQMVLKYAPRQC